MAAVWPCSIHARLRPHGSVFAKVISPRRSQLVAGVNSGERYQTLLGATGTGKTFTMANVIAQTAGRRWLAHNKILRQLRNELRSFFLRTPLSTSFPITLLPAGGLCSGQRHLHRQNGVDQRGDRHAASLGDAIVV